MKKLLKILVLCLVVAISACALFACGETVEEEKGIICKKFKGDSYYTVYGYVDEGLGVTSLDIDAAVKAKYGNDAEVGKIKTNSFLGNSTLKEIIVPDTVVEIADGAFAQMKALKKITLPFIGSTANADSYIGETAAGEDKSVDAARTFGYIFGTEEYSYGATITANYGSGTTTFYIPASLVEVTVSPKEDYKVPAYSFAGVTQINKVNLSEKITVIGDYAFSGANSISEITIPKSVTKIGTGAFSTNSKLTKVTFAENSALTTIGEEAFCQSGVTAIELPSGVTDIGNRCFKESKIVSIKLSASLTSVGNYAFYNCSALKTVEFNGTALIKAGNDAFRKCSELNADTAFKAHFDVTDSVNVFDE